MGSAQSNPNKKPTRERIAPAPAGAERGQPIPGGALKAASPVYLLAAPSERKPLVFLILAFMAPKPQVL